MTLPTGSLFEDRYEILGQLGSGSFGRVYQARQLSTGKLVAIKLLSPREGSASSTGREAERFRREARIGATLSHPNVVELMDAGETREGQLYAVFAQVSGETLEQVLSREGRLVVRESVRLMTQVLEALAAAHAQGIVHRDLKPANLMLSAAGVRRSALVLDFGLGGLAEGRRRAEWQTLTQTREFLGTPLYASPEQLAGEAATVRSDLYAWGLIFLECLTGRHPFEAAGAMERLLMGGGAVEIPEWLGGHRLGALIETVTAREPAQRDIPVESLIDALDEVVTGELPVAPEETSTPAPLSETGERRHLTVMFCDLVGSTALSQQLDAETYREIVRAYQARGAESVERYGGHVVQYLGDGLLVYFGYPQAHEDDAERAIRAGRGLMRHLEGLSAQTEARHGVAIAARVGIDSGPVVLGEMGGGETREILALGDTVNIAARLEAFAEPGTVVISEATRRLVPGLFVTEDCGTPELKGISDPIRVHRVVRSSGVTSRLDRAGSLTPFVGREQELGLLLDRFEQAQEGRGQAVWISGEAGIGKSRLVHQLRQALRETPHSWLECRTSTYTQQSALHPVIELLEQALGFAEDGSAERRVESLERMLASSQLEAAEALPLFASLLSLRLPERYAPLEISPQLQRQKTLEALLAWLLARSEKRPLVLLVEDLHWADPSTLELLGLLVEQCATAGVLLLFTFRPDFEPPWPARGHVLPIALSRLNRRQTRELIAAASEEALSGAVLDRLAARCDGIPLFGEELTKTVAGSTRELAGSLAGLVIPTTLQDSLTARLDGLGEAKQVAQIGAAIGREFPYGLLEAVAPMPEVALREGLGELVQAELAYQRGLPPNATYTFKHALVQDAAYQSLLDSQRRELHGRIADALERRFPERVAREPEEIGRHCEGAGRAEQAISHYREAGREAMQRFARVEAIDHLRTALALLARLPESSERNTVELQLQLDLGAPLIGVRGYGDPGVQRVHERARELCQQVGEGPELFRALIGLSLFHYMQGRLSAAAELAEQALVLADRSGDAYSRLVAHTELGRTLNIAGDPRGYGHLERAVSFHDPAKHRALGATWGQDWGISARSYLANALWERGYPERASRLSRETVELAREGDAYSLASALSWAAFLAERLGHRERALECVDQCIAISEECGYPVWLALSRCNKHRILGGPEGLEGLRRDRAGVLEDSPMVDLALARINLELGRTAEALAPIEARLARPSENHHLDSDLLQMRGAILLEQGSAAEAERCFRMAMEAASHLELKSHELRAATHLGRLLRDQGRRDEARGLVQPVYDWFTEGFDTADLKDARALLDELS